MKIQTINFLTSLGLVLGLSGIYTQTNFYAENSTIKHLQQERKVRDSLIDKFVGTWSYSDQKTKFKLVLTKEETRLGGENSKIFVEQLNGGYSATKNDQEIVHSLKKTFGVPLTGVKIRQLY